jgi:zinc transporter 11
MTAASFWSLLDPAFKIAREQNYVNSQLNFVLIIFGFLLGGLFVHMTDLLLPSITSKQVFQIISNKKNDEFKLKSQQETVSDFNINSVVRSRLKRNQDIKTKLHTPIGDSPMEETKEMQINHDERIKWRRLLLLIIAVTVHNFPG